ncbi:MAG: hypothetical protein OIN87_08520 [Candidatus Methanoperedens sp.]|nr:hypothetical protein [Candidatus Methanoperedens sp.]
MSELDLKEFNRDRWEHIESSKWKRFGVPSIIAGLFITFAVIWVFLIPAAVIGLLILGLYVYMKERKHRISVSIKPTEAMKAIARREKELHREKEKIMYESFQK